MKDKKELEALSSLCAENNVIMVRSFLPNNIRTKRRHLKSGIQQYKGSIWVLRQLRHHIQFYKSKAEDKKGWIALEKRIELYEKSIKVLPTLVDMEIAGYKISTFEH